MASLHQAFLALCIISSSNFLFGECSTKSQLEKINKDLVAALPSDGYFVELDENIEALKQMMEKNASINVEYKETIKELISLNEIKCDKVTFSILRKLNKALDDKPLRKDPIRRLDKIMREFSLKHAKECLTEYPRILDSKIGSLDEDKTEYTNCFVYCMISDRDHDSWWDFGSDWIKAKQLYKDYVRRPVNWKEEIYGVYRALKASTNDKEDSKHLERVVDEVAGTVGIDKKKLRGIYNKYLVEPCDYYVKELGPEVFMPLEYDAQLYHKADDSKRDFYRTWAEYSICKQFLDQKVAVFDGLIEFFNH